MVPSPGLYGLHLDCFLMLAVHGLNLIQFLQNCPKLKPWVDLSAPPITTNYKLKTDRTQWKSVGQKGTTTNQIQSLLRYLVSHGSGRCPFTIASKGRFLHSIQTAKHRWDNLLSSLVQPIGFKKEIVTCVTSLKPCTHRPNVERHHPVQ